ncbi:LytR C-terminal domain-containing protein [Streptomyces radiopugnans]|uniref:Anionic cell wall polymer biosynthesis enzyme, LytR-Cps2A-Psr (LCP) family n=1 Tax=Streptomyces radiopugnans TaxID=403935 RepID=A0A1H8Z4G6_9ACTN|nr:LytR C-terminal domain-containing protein [Streptomyces radiopugnans]SEP59147.1 Anionic cell wall polymer biosynthesis enzyme, LytR-Cps2A-Psr (LCP) family [Streptomyces radiopugnans]
MNDRQDPYGLGDPPQASGHIYGYDEYGRPVYGEQGHDSPAGQYGDASYDPAYGSAYGQGPGTGQQPAYDPYGTGAYGTGAHDPGTYAPDSYAPDPYAAGARGGYAPDAYAQGGPYAPGSPADGYDGQGRYGDWDSSATGHQEPVTEAWIPQQAQGPWYGERSAGDAGPAGSAGAEAATETGPGADRGAGGRAGDGAPTGDGTDADEYRTEEFSFVEEQDEESEDVIDWLKFSESRTERREEAKRRGRNRTVALVVALAVVLAGGVGWLWWAGMLPGTSGDGGAAEAASSAQKRKVIVVHLREIDGGEMSTALLVNNETAGRGTTVLLPNSLVVSSGGTGGGTTLGKSFEAEGAAATRDALGLLLGTDIRGTWRLDTPYLENWVDLVGGISLDADATVPGAKEGDDPLVRRGKGRDLDGRAAVAYATHRAAGEPQTKQLARFGQVLRATLEKMSDDPKTATGTVRALTQILDPSLTDGQLGASLASLAGYARKDAYGTELLPVEADGTLSDATSEGLVKDVLGGTVKNTDPNATPRVSLKDATGDEKAANNARVALVNGGYTVVGGGSADSAQATTRVTYSDAGDRARAEEVARTLGLSEKAVAKGKGAANADITVVLGRDYGSGGQ